MERRIMKMKIIISYSLKKMFCSYFGSSFKNAESYNSHNASGLHLVPSSLINAQVPDVEFFTNNIAISQSHRTYYTSFFPYDE